MRDFTVTRTIAAPPETVWEILADVGRWPEWTDSIAGVERLDAGPLAVGSRVRIRQPRLPPAVWRVTAWEPGRRFTWVARGPGFRTVADHVLRPDGDGCTAEHRIRYEGMLGGLAGLVFGRITARYLGMEADGLRARSEAASREP